MKNWVFLAKTTLTSQSCEQAVLEVDRPAPVNASADHSLAHHFDYNLEKDPEPEPSSLSSSQIPHPRKLWDSEYWWFFKDANLWSNLLCSNK